MVKRSVASWLADALVAVVTWTAAILGLLWFYDWLGRWYVVVGVLLAVVVGAMVGERAKPRGVGGVSAVVAALPSPREPEFEARAGFEPRPQPEPELRPQLGVQPQPEPVGGVTEARPIAVIT